MKFVEDRVGIFLEEVVEFVMVVVQKVVELV